MRSPPGSVAELERRFPGERACTEFLAELRWRDGFECPRCEGREAWRTKRAQAMCKSCGRQVSATAGTIFHGSHAPLTTWFRAAWWVAGQKGGASALGLHRVLGWGSYETAWFLLHRLRRAMVMAERQRLTGTVEVDETFVGGYHRGMRGRDLTRKALVVIAVECHGDACGRVRMRRVLDSSAQSLAGFVSETVERSSVVVTDGLASYVGLTSRGYVHEARNQSASTSDENLLPHAHRVASLQRGEDEAHTCSRAAANAARAVTNAERLVLLRRAADEIQRVRDELRQPTVLCPHCERAPGLPAAAAAWRLRLGGARSTRDGQSRPILGPFPSTGSRCPSQAFNSRRPSGEAAPAAHASSP